MEKSIEIYKTSEGAEVSVVLEKDTLWATQRQIAEIFDTTSQNITMHLSNIYKEGEVDEKATCKEGLQVQKATCVIFARVEK